VVQTAFPIGTSAKPFLGQRRVAFLSQSRVGPLKIGNHPVLRRSHTSPPGLSRIGCQLFRRVDVVRRISNSYAGASYVLIRRSANETRRPLSAIVEHSISSVGLRSKG
jgi:hypothetical protein